MCLRSWLWDVHNLRNSINLNLLGIAQYCPSSPGPTPLILGLLPTAYKVWEEGNVSTGVCLFTGEGVCMEGEHLPREYGQYTVGTHPYWNEFLLSKGYWKSLIDGGIFSLLNNMQGTDQIFLCLIGMGEDYWSNSVARRPHFYTMLKRGVAFHHAGLDNKKRVAVEILFRKKFLKVCANQEFLWKGKIWKSLKFVTWCNWNTHVKYKGCQKDIMTFECKRLDGNVVLCCI